MANKTKKSEIDAASVQHQYDTDAASVKQIRYLSAPLLQKFRANLNKNVANMPQTWLPMEVSLLIRYEFCTLSTHTRYIFVAILLHCAARGTDEIPVDTAFLANALAVDPRTIPKSISELENSKLLRERKTERAEGRDTDRQTEGVSVNIKNLSENEDESEEVLKRKRRLFTVIVRSSVWTNAFVTSRSANRTAMQFRTPEHWQRIFIVRANRTLS